MNNKYFSIFYFNFTAITGCLLNFKLNYFLKFSQNSLKLSLKFLSNFKNNKN